MIEFDISKLTKYIKGNIIPNNNFEKFLDENKDLLLNNDFDNLFEKIIDMPNYLTAILLISDINFLDYMSEIPEI